MPKFFMILAIVVLASVSPSLATVWSVTISNFQFAPANLVILQGDTVVWTNTERTHSVQQDCDPPYFGNDPAPAPWAYMFVFNIPIGLYPYHCAIHPDDMKGSISVHRRGLWQVTVRDFSFTPASLTITTGDTVVWSNVQGTHSVHDLGGAFDHPIAPAPWVYMFIFNVDQSYNYVCERHPDVMQGTVKVFAPQPQPAPSDLVIFPSDVDMNLQWSGPCYASYAIDRSTDPVNWGAATRLAVVRDVFYTDPSPPDARAYYRVTAEY